MPYAVDIVSLDQQGIVFNLANFFASRISKSRMSQHEATPQPIRARRCLPCKWRSMCRQRSYRAASRGVSRNLRPFEPRRHLRTCKSLDTTGAPLSAPVMNRVVATSARSDRRQDDSAEGAARPERRHLLLPERQHTRLHTEGQDFRDLHAKFRRQKTLFSAFHEIASRRTRNFREKQSFRST